jgi:hypothetical protein
MQNDEPGKGSPGRGLRVAVLILVILSIAASAVAVVQSNELADERARADRLAEDLADSRAKLNELEAESDPDDPQPPPPDNQGDDNPFADVFGGDIGSLLECVGTQGEPGADDDAENARAQLEEISNAVEELREMRFKHEVDARFLDPGAVAAKAGRITLRDYPQAVADAEGRMLEALGAIPRDTDLRSMTKELIKSQVAGFYVPKTDQLVVPGSPEKPLSPGEKVILAHELTHALTDGQLEIPLPEHPDPADLDEDLAALAVVEGDATLLMQRYAVTHLSVFDQLSMTSDPAYQASQEAIEKIPPYLVEQLTYPYVEGLNFTCELYAKGGWKAVNAAYDDPPTTTAQVLFPERYAREEKARDPSTPPAPVGAWREVWQSSFGAANLVWLFKAPGGDEEAALRDLDGRVDAWAGGGVHVWARGRDTALALRLTERKGGDLCTTMAEWYDASFDDDSEAAAKTSETAAFDGGSQSAVISCPGAEVRLGVGPDLQTARRAVR